MTRESLLHVVTGGCGNLAGTEAESSMAQTYLCVSESLVAVGVFSAAEEAIDGWMDG